LAAGFDRKPPSSEPPEIEIEIEIHIDAYR